LNKTKDTQMILKSSAKLRHDECDTMDC